MTNGVPPTRASDIDIRPSLNLVLLCLLLCVLALNVVMERIVGVSAMMVITLAVFASTGAAWLLGRLHGALSRWFLVLALLALLAAASIGAGMHELLVLTVLPIALAAALLDLRSAAVVCGITTAVLLALGRQVFPHVRIRHFLRRLRRSGLPVQCHRAGQQGAECDADCHR